ncbi:hypothetical protein C5715_23955 [Escherichia coli]|nr:hypothetical protein [Escherichia coli]PPA51892.1 hypothetical protein C3727_22985 [Escherichia coli]PQP28199.1 hypothetical protein C5715_23955 [Escherichia coli]
MDPEKGVLFIRKDSLMNIEKIRETFSENGLYAVRVENGEVIYTTLIPDDHVILSIEAFVEYLERLGFKVARE